MSNTEQSSSPAEELRSAAQKLREAADMATPGPWSYGGGMVGLGIKRVEPCIYAYRARIAELVDEDDRDNYRASEIPMGDEDNDGAWMAMMSPLLAEPLAGVFDEYAARYDLHVSSVLCHYDHGDTCKGHLRPVCGNCASWVDSVEYRCTCWDKALTAARLINGGESR